MKDWRSIFLTSNISKAAITLFIPLTLWAQPKKISTDQLTREADVIVVGKVGKLVSEWTENKSRIQTRVTISVAEMIKGTDPASSITVVIPGGEVDGVGEWYSHTVRFDRDEDVLVFAQKDKKGDLSIPSGVSGKFSIKTEKASGAKTIPNVGALETATSKIRRHLESLKTDQKQK